MTQAETDIRLAVQTLINSWNTHDPECFAASFSSDAQFTDVLGNTAEGRDAIAQLHAFPFARLFRQAELVVRQAPVQLITDDVASVGLRWTMQGSTTAQGEPWPPRQGVMLLVLVRREQHWWPIVAQNSDHPG